MPECQHLSRCLFYKDKMDDMPVTAEMFKHRFCTGDYSNCARFMVSKALGASAVPPHLFPNQTEKAKQLIASGWKLSTMESTG